MSRSNTDDAALKRYLARMTLHSFVYSMLIYVHYDPHVHMDTRGDIDQSSFVNILRPPRVRSVLPVQYITVIALNFNIPPTRKHLRTFAGPFWHWSELDLENSPSTRHCYHSTVKILRCSNDVSSERLQGHIA